MLFEAYPRPGSLLCGVGRSRTKHSSGSRPRRYCLPPSLPLVQGPRKPLVPCRVHSMAALAADSL